jgi:hypothetical protein
MIHRYLFCVGSPCRSGMLAFSRTDRIATVSGLRSRLNRAAKSSLFALAQRSLWLRAESLAVLAGVVWLYAQHGGGWLLFALLFVVPDFSLLAGVASRALGAAVYNVALRLGRRTCIGGFSKR